MLYLEDYLEIIEHLPQELRERFTEMREMDLSVQNNTDALDKRVRALFQQCRRGEISTSMADSEFDSIRTNYYRVLDDSDEKIQLAAQMYDLVERYLRRLDTELFKFKCELEADHNGITEVLEKRSLELDTTTTNGGLNQKENRFYDTQNSHGGGSGHTPSSRSDSRYKVKADKRRNSVAASVSLGAVEKRQGAGSSKPLNNAVACVQTNASPVVAGVVPGAATVAMVGPVAAATVVPGTVVPGTVPGTPTVASSYNLQTCGAGNAIVAAASQAIAQTQQMQQGRRTASLKASYEAIGGVGSHELLLNSELAGATHNALQAVELETLIINNPSTSASAGSSSGAATASGSGTGGGTGGNITDQGGTVQEQAPEGEWFDPNEPRYCLCNQVSYGDMVACDNEGCPFEWFHYPCVNISSSPKGKWYCPQCSSSMKRRASRKN
uniref:Inhibitor of growth protein n=1 Tax=Anopheles farauti TaxID=69004 RepID=A0A182Q1X6_9DIPT